MRATNMRLVFLSSLSRLDVKKCYYFITYFITMYKVIYYEHRLLIASIHYYKIGY